MSHLSEEPDWQAMHDRLAELEKDLSDGLALDEAQRDSMLRHRARQLARETRRDRDRIPHRDWLMVGCQGAYYAFPLTGISGVIETPPAALLPGGSLRLICHRGEFWSLASLRALAGGAATWSLEAEAERAVLLRHPQWRLALACPEVIGIRSVPTDALARPEQPDGLVEHYFRDADRLVSVLDPDALFSTLR